MYPIQCPVCVYLYQSAELRECKNVKLNLARPSRHYLDIKRSYFSPYLHYSRPDTYILAPSITRLLFYTRADRRQTHGRIICRGCARSGGGWESEGMGVVTRSVLLPLLLLWCQRQQNQLASQEAVKPASTARRCIVVSRLEQAQTHTQTYIRCIRA